MTINSNSIQSGLLISEQPVEGAMAVPKALDAGPGSESGEGIGEGEFWAMLSRNLAEVVAGDDSQVIENKELLSALKELEAELEAGKADMMPGTWMQFLKSHFSQWLEQSESTLEMEAAADEIPVFSGLQMEHTQPDALPLVLPLAGDHLPSLRQSVSALSSSADTPILPLAIAQGELSSADATWQQQLGESRRLLLSEVAEQQGQQKPAFESMMLKAAALGDGAALKSPEFVPTAIQPVLNTINPQAVSTSQLLPADLQNLSLSPSGGNQQWGNAIGERVAFLINHRLNSAEIRLDPPHLGKLDIQIQVKDDSALVVINTSQAQTRDLVESASLRLREFLQDAGYSSVDVNVSHQESSGQQDLASNKGAEATRQPDGAASDDDMLSNSLMQTASMVVDDGRIDYFA